MFSRDLLAHAEDVIARLRAHEAQLITAESCTGGLIGAVLTEIAGASDVIDCGFITYSNAAKAEMIGVDARLLKEHGAVSEPVARAMAEGALAKISRASLAIAVTGIAGPSGGSAEKPVGLVHLALAIRNAQTVHQRCLFGNLGRTEVRLATVRQAFRMIREAL